MQDAAFLGFHSTVRAAVIDNDEPSSRWPAFMDKKNRPRVPRSVRHRAATITIFAI